MEIREYYDHLKDRDGFVLLDENGHNDGELYANRTDALSALRNAATFLCPDLRKAVVTFPKDLSFCVETTMNPATGQVEHRIQVSFNDGCHVDDTLLHESWYDDRDECDHDADLLHDYFDMSQA